MYDIFFLGNAGTEWDILKLQYPNAQRLEKNTSFDEICKRSFTKLFWLVWDDIILDVSFNLNNYKATQWDNKYIHVFKNGKHFDGICLIPKSATVSQREFDNRFFVNNKKEIDIVASQPKSFDIFYINEYEEYLNAQNVSTTDMFWVIWKDVAVLPHFKFDYKIPKYEQHIPHVFKNGEYYDGICIFSKFHTVTKKEFDNRFFVNTKKEIDIVASHPKPFDIIFISYNESNADENYNQLCKKFPRAKRVHGVKGIHQAHIEAAKLCETNMLWVVDADAIIVDDFNFMVEHIPYYSSNARRMLTSTVHVWRSRNPINGLEYGYGGVKLLPKDLTLKMDVDSADMTTSISKLFKAMPEVSNITAFNTDPFSTWRSAFRECVKLSSKIINGQDDTETQSRLEIWCTVGNNMYAIAGATAGRNYGTQHKNDVDALKKINDFNWLKEQFDASR
jgi:hypothetical protein